jgi:hypothetical protein
MRATVVVAAVAAAFGPTVAAQAADAPPRMTKKVAVQYIGGCWFLLHGFDFGQPCRNWKWHKFVRFTRTHERVVGYKRVAYWGHCTHHITVGVDDPSRIICVQRTDIRYPRSKVWRNYPHNTPPRYTFKIRFMVGWHGPDQAGQYFPSFPPDEMFYVDEHGHILGAYDPSGPDPSPIAPEPEPADGWLA